MGLSPRLSTQLLLNPTKPLPTQGINFAFAGALSSDLNVIDDDATFLAGFLPGFQTQVDTFATLSAFAPPNPNALNVVWVGGNDYNEAFFNPASLGGLSLEQLPNSVTGNIVNGLTQLSSLGAKNFLVVNLPSLGETPLADSLDTETQQNVSSLLNQLTATHNKLLSEKLGAFGQSHTGTNVTELDVNTLFSDLLADPSAFGLTNVTDPCLTNFFDVCDNPDQFLFWDDIHPTTAAYQIVSNFALASLENINENTAPPINVLEPVSLTALSSTESPASVPEPTSLTALFIMGAVGSRALAKRKRLKATSS